MSLSRHANSRLSGWNGPFYPALTPQLAEALDGRPEGSRNGSDLEAAVRDVAGFVRMFRPETATDGYGWFWALEFDVVHNGKVLVAIPWAQDATGADGTRLDRSPAAYVKGRSTNVDTANAVLARVIRALRPDPGRRPILTGP